MKRKIGIYSGTFDPIHEGHIAFARETLKECHLDKVLFLPEPRPRNKKYVTPIRQREHAITSTIGISPFLKMHHTKADRFTLHTLMPEITALYPEATFVLLVGSDVAKMLHTWADIRTLMQTAKFAIGLRNEDTVNDISLIMQSLEKQVGAHINYQVITTKYATVSSSKKRAITQ